MSKDKVNLQNTCSLLLSCVRSYKTNEMCLLDFEEVYLSLVKGFFAITRWKLR